jgi:hypothetical protein
MRKATALWAALLLASGLQAAPPPEVIQVKLDGVDAASRELLADGTTWAMSSTVAIKVPGLKRASLGDLKPGMNVRLVLVSTDGEVSVVSGVTVLPD